MKQMNRRIFLSLFASPLPAGAAWSRFVEPEYFELTHTTVPLPKASPKRILHISDIHMSDGMTAADLRTGLQAGLARKPDLICFTGDYVSETTNFDRQGLVNLLQSASATAPTFAVLGNHDGGAWLHRWGGNRSTALIRDLIESAGVHLLHNESAAIGDITVIGVADLWSGEFAPEKAFAKAPNTAATIVLCHNPDAKTSLVHHPWDLMLSGHTHGGQVRIPGITPTWVPVADKRFIAGLYEWENRHLFITRGLGSPRHVRAFCRPEISLLHITGA